MRQSSFPQKPPPERTKVIHNFNARGAKRGYIGTREATCYVCTQLKACLVADTSGGNFSEFCICQECATAAFEAK